MIGKMSLLLKVNKAYVEPIGRKQALVVFIAVSLGEVCLVPYS